MASNKRAKPTGKKAGGPNKGSGNGNAIDLPVVWARNAPHFNPNVKNIKFEGTSFENGMPVMDKGRILFRNGYGLDVQRHWRKGLHGRPVTGHYAWRMLATMYDGRVLDEFDPRMPIAISARIDAEFPEFFTWTADDYRKCASDSMLNTVLRKVQAMYRHTMSPQPDDYLSTVEVRRKRSGTRRSAKKQLKFDL